MNIGKIIKRREIDPLYLPKPLRREAPKRIPAPVRTPEKEREKVQA